MSTPKNMSKSDKLLYKFLKIYFKDGMDSKKTADFAIEVCDYWEKKKRKKQ